MANYILADDSAEASLFLRALCVLMLDDAGQELDDALLEDAFEEQAEAESVDGDEVIWGMSELEKQAALETDLTVDA